MKPLGYTKLYDYIVDQYLPELSGSELKVLIIIIRSTIGWNKEKDRITQGQFCTRTRLSRRAVSSAITSLEAQGLIAVTGAYGQSLPPKERQYNQHIFYQLAEYAYTKSAHLRAKNAHVHGQKVHITIYSDRQQEIRETSSKKQSDSQRIAELGC
jgi:phage replication O-like protein O